MKQYLCIEDNEYFTLEATHLADAREAASVWNASVIRELTTEEARTGKVKV